MHRKPKVAIFTLYDTEGASSKFRIYQYVADMQEYADLTIFKFWPNLYVNKYMRNKRKYALQIAFLYMICAIKRLYQLYFCATCYDAVIIQKASIPKIKNDFLEKIKKRNIRILFDVDDAVYLNKRDNTNLIASKADIVFCGSHILLEHYKKYNPNVLFVPTVENPLEYNRFKHCTYDDKIIGWIGNSGNISNLDIVVEPINNIIKKHPEVRFHLISNADGGICDKINNSYFIKWSEQTSVSELSRLTVGIMPLIDTDFNRGKCGFKLIQYMTMEKPVVGSPVGENQVIIEYGGFIAKSAYEWENYLEELLFNEKIYNKCVERIQSNFLIKYNYQSNCAMFHSFICEEV